MDNFGLVGALRTYATGKGWKFIYGEEEHKNYEADQTMAKGQLILGSFGFIGSPGIINSKYTEIIYAGDLYLGRKFEVAGTVSSLDETNIQKWDRRLQYLASTLASTIGLFSCQHELDVSGISMRQEINRYDTNIDFVATLVTFNQIPS